MIGKCQLTHGSDAVGVTLAALAWLLASLPDTACAHEAVLPEPGRAVFMTEQPDQGASTAPLIEAATRDLALRLSVEASAIELIQFEEVTWPDTSLGCPSPGMKYRQVPSDGYRILLSVAGKQYAYHGNGRRGPFYCPEDSLKRHPPSRLPAGT